MNNNNSVIRNIPVLSQVYSTNLNGSYFISFLLKRGRGKRRNLVKIFNFFFFFLFFELLFYKSIENYQSLK